MSLARIAAASLLAAVVSPATRPLAAQHSPCVSDCAELVVVNGRVWTGVRGAPDAQALAVRARRLLAVGSNTEVNRRVGPATRVMDAGGRLLVPGLFDSHVHFVTAGAALASVQLRDARTREEFIRRIRDYARTLPPGAWITEGNWDHSLWGGELPRREWIDSITPHNPVWISRLDGHMALANSAALSAARVDAATGNVEGGEIVRDASGAPTGILKDNALGLVERVVPGLAPEQEDRALDAAMAYVAERGVTSVVHMGDWGGLAVFRRAQGAGRLRTRISASVPLDSWARLRDTVAVRGRGDSWLRIGGLKGFVDGSLGSHTALFHQPYTDAPGDSGLLVTPADSLYAWTRAADQAGLQVMVHAIGDRANTLILDIYERVAREDGPRDRRFRVEHAQHIRPTDIPRFGRLGVVASMQPYHAIDDGRWASPLIGPERTRTTYPFRTLLDTGAHLAFGSDWFVAPPTPLEGIYAAVTRRTLDDRNPGGWVPEEKITVEEALRGYTVEAAWATFQEHDLGTLEAGKLADFVMIDRDLRTIPPETLRDARVLMTVVGGRVVYQRPTQ